MTDTKLNNRILYPVLNKITSKHASQPHFKCLSLVSLPASIHTLPNLFLHLFLTFLFAGVFFAWVGTSQSVLLFFSCSSGSDQGSHNRHSSGSSQCVPLPFIQMLFTQCLHVDHVPFIKLKAWILNGKLIRHRSLSN